MQIDDLQLYAKVRGSIVMSNTMICHRKNVYFTNGLVAEGVRIGTYYE
jgi:hypothetical protein